MKVQESIEITAPPERVWPHLTQPQRIRKWATAFEKFEFTGDQQTGVGTRLYLEEKAPVGPLMKVHAAVTDWEDNRKLAFSMTTGESVKAHNQLWSLEKVPTGTRVTMTEEVELANGLWGRLLEMFCKGSCQERLQHMLLRLKRQAEI